MQRYTVARVVLHLFGGEAILKPGANDTGGNAVHPDIQIGQFARQRPRELRYRALSHPVGNGTRTTAGPRRRGNQQDRAPAALDHARNRRPGEMVHGVDVDVEGPVPGAGVYFAQAAIRRAARETAHRDIGPAKSKLARRSRTDAAAPTGYQANLSFQFHFVPVAALTFVIGWRREPRELDPRAPAPPDSPPTPRAGRRNTPGRRVSTSTSHRSGEHRR